MIFFDKNDKSDKNVKKNRLKVKTGQKGTKQDQTESDGRQKLGDQK